MRTRMVSPEFFRHRGLCELGPLHQVLFQGLWCAANRGGKLRDRPEHIKLDVLPWYDCDVDRMLDDLAGRGFIARYEVEGERYIAVVKFAKHQRPNHREARDTLPDPPETPGNARACPGMPGNARVRPGHTDTVESNLEGSVSSLATLGKTLGGREVTLSSLDPEKVTSELCKGGGAQFALPGVKAAAAQVPRLVDVDSWQWLIDRMVEIWRERMGGGEMAVERAVRPLRKLRRDKRNDNQTILAAFVRYLAATEACYASVPDFCAKFGYWAERTNEPGPKQFRSATELAAEEARRIVKGETANGRESDTRDAGSAFGRGGRRDVARRALDDETTARLRSDPSRQPAADR